MSERVCILRVYAWKYTTDCCVHRNVQVWIQRQIFYVYSNTESIDTIPIKRTMLVGKISGKNWSQRWIQLRSVSCVRTHSSKEQSFSIVRIALLHLCCCVCDSHSAVKFFGATNFRLDLYSMHSAHIACDAFFVNHFSFSLHLQYKLTFSWVRHRIRTGRKRNIHRNGEKKAQKSKSASTKTSKIRIKFSKQRRYYDKQQ